MVAAAGGRRPQIYDSCPGSGAAGTDAAVL